MAYIQQQPMATPGMMPMGGNRNAKNLPIDAEGREWSNGLCDCCNDAGTCLMSWFCPCVVYGQNKLRREHLEKQGVPDPEHGGCSSGDCWMHCLIQSCCGAGWILQMGTRGNTRARYNIKGGAVGDCCAAFWCTPCTLTQESQEILLEEQSFQGYQKA